MDPAVTTCSPVEATSATTAPGRDPLTVSGESWFEAGQRATLSTEADIQAILAENPDWLKDTVLPRRVTIETVFGCNAKCGMCVIDDPSDRKKGIMPMDLFKRIVDSLVPYKERLELFDLFALGEPLLDPLICERIRYVKSKGFRRLAFATNAHLLNERKQQDLLETGIETLIFSLDGITKETHEAIRERVDYDRALGNVLSIIKRRNEGGYKTRFIVRFVRQPRNTHEWERYKTFWVTQISPEKGDLVAVYDMHTWAGGIDSKDHVLGAENKQPEIEREPCHHAFNNLTILADGSMPLCSEDILSAKYKFGNTKFQDPIEVFNSPRFKAMRNLHLAGKKSLLKGCGECTILYSERKRASFT